jgi:hypothetical protein
MGGLLVLFLIGLYIWIAFKIVRHTRPLWGKGLIIVAAILIPTADAVYGRYKLKEMCAAEGGLRIYRVVEGVAGFDDPKSRPDESELRIRKYQFVEGKELSGKRSRLSVRPDGTYIREEGITPISEYVYENERGNDKDIYYRSEQRIRVKISGEILGRYIDFNYAGGWFERFVNGLYAARGTAGTCGPFLYATELVPQILKPIKSESKS